MDNVVKGNSQRGGILHRVKQIAQKLKKNGRGIKLVVFVLLCICGAIGMVAAIVIKVVKADYKQGGIGLDQEDIMIVIGACLMVLAMNFWYRHSGNVSIMELFTRHNTLNLISIPANDLDVTVTLV